MSKQAMDPAVRRKGFLVAKRPVSGKRCFQANLVGGAHDMEGIVIMMTADSL
jgi:hypothetical protein